MAEAIKQFNISTSEFHKIFGKYIGKHIYLALNKKQTDVIATGKTPLQAIERAHALGYKHPIIMLAPINDNWGYLL